jgi:hypothetical protein
MKTFAAFALAPSTVAVKLALALALVGVGAQQPGAQQSGNPGLQHRPAGAPADQTVKVVLEGGATVLPEDAFGLYRFADRAGEFGEGLQINQQFGEVTGYFSVSAGSKSHGKLLTYFLSEVQGGAIGGHFAFTTRQVHGVWYSFDGKLSRGPGLNATEDGLYLLNGTLTAHDDAQKTPQSKSISMKLTGMR